MKVLSLFDGMACGMLAMLGAGVPVDRYVAYEIDKYAVQTSSHNFPNIEHRGDVFKADFTEFRGFDWLIGGSPCTYWSIAQKNNRETEASGIGWELFSQYVRALHEAKPRFFIYENNKSMAPAIRESITETFGFEPICINSALVSGQNRQRLYWVGRRNDDGSYSRVDVEQPEDRGIVLRDILESGYDLTCNEKSYALTASYNGAVAWNTIEKAQRNMVAEPVRIPEYGVEDKSRPVNASYSHKGSGEGSLASDAFPDNPNKQVFDYVAEPIRIGDIGSTAQAHRVYSCDGKSVTLSANGGGQGGKTGLYAVPTYKQCDKVYEVKDGFITIKGKTYPIKLADGFYVIRKLTVRECMRLQTVPEWYEFPVSKSQGYKMLGNGWTVDVIIHLIESVLREE